MLSSLQVYLLVLSFQADVIEVDITIHVTLILVLIQVDVIKMDTTTHATSIHLRRES